MNASGSSRATNRRHGPSAAVEENESASQTAALPAAYCVTVRCTVALRKPGARRSSERAAALRASATLPSGHLRPPPGFARRRRRSHRPSAAHRASLGFWRLDALLLARFEGPSPRCRPRSRLQPTSPTKQPPARAAQARAARPSLLRRCGARWRFSRALQPYGAVLTRVPRTAAADGAGHRSGPVRALRRPGAVPSPHRASLRQKSSRQPPCAAALSACVLLFRLTRAAPLRYVALVRSKRRSRRAWRPRCSCRWARASSPCTSTRSSTTPSCGDAWRARRCARLRLQASVALR